MIKFRLLMAVVLVGCLLGAATSASDVDRLDVLANTVGDQRIKAILLAVAGSAKAGTLDAFVSHLVPFVRMQLEQIQKELKQREGKGNP